MFRLRWSQRPHSWLSHDYKENGGISVRPSWRHVHLGHIACGTGRCYHDYWLSSIVDISQFRDGAICSLKKFSLKFVSQSLINHSAFIQDIDWRWTGKSLQWRYNECDDVSYHRRLDCLFNRLFRRRSKKTSKLRVTGLYEGNPPIGEFPAQRASNAENVSIWWRHHVVTLTRVSKLDHHCFRQKLPACSRQATCEPILTVCQMDPYEQTSMKFE